MMNRRRSEKNASISSSDKQVKSLIEDGIVTIPNYISDSKCDQIKEELESIVEDDHEDVLYPVGPEERDKIDIDGVNEAVAFKFAPDDSNKRDAGMIDIHHAERKVPELKEIKYDDTIKNIINQTSYEGFRPTILHAYVNKSVTNTFDYHMDGTGKPCFKAFIYLTDVNDDKHGPYSYVPGSHKSDIGRILNIFYNTIRGKILTRMDLFFPDKAENITADKGTLIISNQNGVHRGIPQQEGKERYALVIRYGDESPHS